MFRSNKTSKITELNQCRTAAGITRIQEPMTPNTNSCPWSFTRWLSYRYSENRSNTHEQATFWKRVDGSRKEIKTTAARNRDRGPGWILKRRDGDLALTSRKLCARYSCSPPCLKWYCAPAERKIKLITLKLMKELIINSLVNDFESKFVMIVCV